MGTNRRYAHRIDENMARRATEAAARPRPLGLTPSELDLKNNPIIEVQEPIPVQAWVTWQTQPVLTQARAVKWTARAVCIEWTDGTGATYQSWVWASAVDRL